VNELIQCYSQADRESSNEANNRTIPAHSNTAQSDHPLSIEPPRHSNGVEPATPMTTPSNSSHSRGGSGSGRDNRSGRTEVETDFRAKNELLMLLAVNNMTNYRQCEQYKQLESRKSNANSTNNSLLVPSP
jgi:hypothetical protein